MELRRHWSEGMETKCLGILFHVNGFKSGHLQSLSECIGIERDECVAYMDQAHVETLQAVASGENATRTQNAADFAKQLVLQSY